MGKIYSCFYNREIIKFTCKQEKLISKRQNVNNNDDRCIVPENSTDFYCKIKEIILKYKNYQTRSDGDLQCDMLFPEYPNFYDDIMREISEFTDINEIPELFISISELPMENKLVSSDEFRALTIDKFNETMVKEDLLVELLNMSEDSLKSLSREKFLETVASSGLVLNLISYKEHFKRCIFILQLSIRHRIEFADSCQLIAQSFYFSNYHVLRYLILNGINKAPLIIHFNDEERHFLVLLMDKMVLEDKYYFLHDILKYILQYYSEIDAYLLSMDNVIKKNLFHNLLCIYEICHNAQLENHMVNCLTEIIKTRPCIARLKFPIPKSNEDKMDYIQYMIFMDSSKSVALLKCLLRYINLDPCFEKPYYRAIFQDRHRENQNILMDHEMCLLWEDQKIAVS